VHIPLSGDFKKKSLPAKKQGSAKTLYPAHFKGNTVFFWKNIWKFKNLPHIFASVLYMITYQERQRVMAR